MDVDGREQHCSQRLQRILLWTVWHVRRTGYNCPANVLGGRGLGSGWIDDQGDLWLFAGLGIDSTGNLSFENGDAVLNAEITPSGI
jgi:hypothetical protein